MSASTTRKGLKYAATILGAFAVLAVAPATAFATDNDPGPGGGDGGCHYTDADGYDIPIDNGQGVFVDGKIVSCKDGKITVTTQPLRSGGINRAPILNRAPVFAQP
ncbi:hypothetical protein Mycch_0788 [Mycolicibacterium chubuense NBB4]|uniref:Secreted protein n=1 Tax=Mycolicibacterium chubuense (strain NBB4) TaxID=710421 RepID=I4BE98_MYCCN|nr:hypothetical protein [Mycolicibacterium chubuense]AFM15605.1 hypothetical protein Mycch_0788 [Mycolicibacterium chubuense NBB4]